MMMDALYTVKNFIQLPGISKEAELNANNKTASVSQNIQAKKTRKIFSTIMQFCIANIIEIQTEPV